MGTGTDVAMIPCRSPFTSVTPALFAAGFLYPAFGMLLSPMIAAAAMSLSSVSVSVIGNALRLRRMQLSTTGP